MLALLNQLDTELFLFLNSLHSPFWDVIMEKITHSKTWIPLYALIIGVLIYKFKLQGLRLVIIILLLIGFADQVSSRIVKPLANRPRPCDNELIQNQIHGRQSCEGQKGYFSSHASNTFALASLLCFLFYRNHKWILGFVLWAGLVSYSRIYLGLHYPGDILSGALFGSLSAYACFYLIKKYLPEDLKKLQLR